MDQTMIPPNQTNPPETSVAPKPLRVLIADDSENDMLIHVPLDDRIPVQREAITAVEVSVAR